MSFTITANDYVEYIKIVTKRINEDSEYITGLDAITGDGDHWVNINMGFENLVLAADEMAQMSIDNLFKKMGSIMMSKVGGSSGILYGGAYMAAGRALTGKQAMTSADLCLALDTMVTDMMKRGNARPGYKTMIDVLYPVAEMYKKCINQGVSDVDIMAAVKKAAMDGAESTKDMEAVKGRASYQQNKGVGHLDPGAVTMSYQIECLCDYIKNNLLS